MRLPNNKGLFFMKYYSYIYTYDILFFDRGTVHIYNGDICEVLCGWDYDHKGWWTVPSVLYVRENICNNNMASGTINIFNHTNNEKGWWSVK